MVKHFIDIDDFEISELKKILIFAKKIKKNPNKYNNSLNSKTLGMIFEKQSTRTRLSFYVGMKKMGGNVIELNKESIGFGKRESKSDIIKVLSAYIDCLMIRNNDHLEIKKLRNLNCLPIINGLSNYSHPCQILSDIFTIEEKLGPINKLKICWVGDINNVLISLIQASKIFKFKLEISAPEHILKKNNALIKVNQNKLIAFHKDPKKAVKNADCVMTDTWVSMGEKKDILKLKRFKKFQVNSNLMQNAKKKAIFMHCLPAKRNLEVTDEIIDGNQSVVYQQAQNRMFVQQSILKYIIQK